MTNTTRARIATIALLPAAFVLGYVAGSARTPSAGAEASPDRLTKLEANQDTLRRAWNVSREATFRGLRLEPDAHGRYLVMGTSSHAESRQALEQARAGVDEVYLRSLQPTPSSP
jgi:hypothetical protein